MRIEQRSIDEIRPYEDNPRVNDQAVDAVAASLKEFGWRQPIVVDTDGVIIVGHTRWKAAKKLGLEKVPVHVAKDLSAEQIKAYRIADNQTASIAEWNFELLPIELRDLQGMDFDLSLLGFDEDELAKLLDGELTEGLTDPDDVPEPPDEAITQPEDLWILGDHRLLCGDSSTVAVYGMRRRFSPRSRKSLSGGQLHERDTGPRIRRPLGDDRRPSRQGAVRRQRRADYRGHAPRRRRGRRPGDGRRTDQSRLLRRMAGAAGPQGP